MRLMGRRRGGGIIGLLVSDSIPSFCVLYFGCGFWWASWLTCTTAQGFPKARERLEELKQGAKGKKRDIRRSNAKEGDCVVM